MENDTPAYKSMVYYFSKPEISKSKFKGRPRITLYGQMLEDLKKSWFGIKNSRRLSRRHRNCKNPKLWDEIYHNIELNKNIKQEL